MGGMNGRNELNGWNARNGWNELNVWVEWWNGGMVEWWNGGMAEWRNGGIAEWRNSRLGIRRTQHGCVASVRNSYLLFYIEKKLSVDQTIVFSCVEALRNN